MTQSLAIILIAMLVAWIVLCVWDERELLHDAFKAIYGGSSASATDIAEEVSQMHRRINNRSRIAFPGYERFEAWTQCPSCDRIAVHQMRTPKPAPIRGPLRVVEHDDGSRSEIRTFNGMTTTGPDESVYETIRICECGQEWGQR